MVEVAGAAAAAFPEVVAAVAVAAAFRGAATAVSREAVVEIFPGEVAAAPLGQEVLIVPA